MRQQILETVQQKPGIHFREVQRELGCSSTTLNYHLETLDLKEKKFHGYRRFYPEEIPEEMERPLAAMNHDVRGPMLQQMKNGISQKDLVEETELSKSTVSSHVKILRDDGLVEEEKNGRSKDLFLSKLTGKALEKYASRFVDEASEGFIDMWD